MAGTFIVRAGAGKRESYEQVVAQVRSLLEDESDLIANLANIASVLASAFHHHWTGFYIRRGDFLVLGPFQGPLACTRIPLVPVARGVCGAAAERRETLIVPDVDAFPGHIACSSLSRSEIVVPLVKKGETELVLDIDSVNLNEFNEEDREGLEQIVEVIRERHFKE